ncbi:hypothetical protein A343_0102 [Porphyromonas gingivalis JCVI SC001]|nr:hypothetical protein A343_0102 [Porphyromonas gingivalis JCVI SC001]
MTLWGGFADGTRAFQPIILSNNREKNFKTPLYVTLFLLNARK